jgi:hypothetical protein
LFNEWSLDFSWLQITSCSLVSFEFSGDFFQNLDDERILALNDGLASCADAHVVAKARRTDNATPRMVGERKEDEEGEEMSVSNARVP